MSTPHLELARLQGDLALRRLSAQAIRYAHELARDGECSGEYSHALAELERVGLARRAWAGGAKQDDFEPTELLVWLWEHDRMGELEAR